MAGLKIKCVSTKPYLDELPNGHLVEDEYEGEMISLTLNKVYHATDEGYLYYFGI